MRQPYSRNRKHTRRFFQRKREQRRRLAMESLEQRLLLTTLPAIDHLLNPATASEEPRASAIQLVEDLNSQLLACSYIAVPSGLLTATERRATPTVDAVLATSLGLGSGGTTQPAADSMNDATTTVEEPRKSPAVHITHDSAKASAARTSFQTSDSPAFTTAVQSPGHTVSNDWMSRTDTEYDSTRQAGTTDLSLTILSSQSIVTDMGEVALTPSNLGASRALDVQQATTLGLTVADMGVQSASLATVGTALVEDTGKSPAAHVVHVGGQAAPADQVENGTGVNDQTFPTGGDIQPAGAQDNNLLVAGFEAVEGFSPGFINFQSGWGHYAGNVVQPVIETANPAIGDQHLRIEKEPALGTDERVGAVSPNLGSLPAGRYSLSVDVAISGTGGADYDVVTQSPSQGFLTSLVNFSFTGDIRVVDDIGSGAQFVDTGTNWTVGAYKNLTVDIDANANTIEYYYDGSLIHTGVVWAGTSVEQVILRSDNWNFGDVADFDNLVVQDLSGDLPDLSPVGLGNWNDILPIGITQLASGDTHDYAGPFYDDQTLYFNWASNNAGPGLASQYTVHVEVAGSSGESFDWSGITTNSGSTTFLVNDQPVGPLAAGTHTLKVWVDYLDSLYESEELDNYYERTITVLPAGTPAAQPVTLEPFGVSEGIAYFQVNEDITDFGADRAYSVDLVAGQRISAAVQTPDGNPFGYANSTAVTIPDSGATVVSEIVISDSFTIEDLDVSVLIDHRNDADLDIFLLSPGGTLIELSTDNGGNRNGYLNTLFDDEAPISIADSSATAPFAGRHAPESPLSVLDGTGTNGTWQLQITDDTPGGPADGNLLSWSLRFNQGIDTSLTITGPDGQLATNDVAIFGLLDPAIVHVVVPTTGTYTFEVDNRNNNIGQFTLEAGIYDSTVPIETEPTTDLDPLRAANGNVAVLGTGDGIGTEDVYTITLNAGEAVTVAGSTPGGFYGPGLELAGPGGFTTADALFQFGPAADQVLLFTAPQTGQYMITVAYPYASNFLDVISTGTYALSVIISDNANNDSIPNARPISAFDYRDPVETTSLVYDLTGIQGLWRGEIDATSDVDYFHLGQLDPGELIRMTVQREGASQLFPSTLLANSSGQVIGGAQSLRFPPVEGVAVFERIISQADDYYLVVFPEPETVGQPTLSTGDYLLFYSSFASVEDAYEQNDSQAEVDAAAPGDPNSPNLGPVGDVTLIPELAMMEDSNDWFRFETPTTSVRGDYVRILFDHSDGNLNLELIDASGDVIRQSVTVSDNERVSLQGLPAGTYYARVYGSGGARNPAYRLRIQTGSPDHRLLSAPFTTDEQYTLNYELTGAAASSSEQLPHGENVLIVTTPSSGPDPFELLFDVTRVGSMVDQTSTQYDLLGNPSRETDALGRDTTYVYDDLGRLVVIDGPEIGDASGYTYDGNDNLTQVIDTAFGAGTTGYAYDELDRLTAITLPDGLGTIGYTYDLADRIASITYPDSTVVAYTYDAAGRLATVTEGTDVTSYTYYPDGLMETVTLPNDITATYTYDTHARLTDLVYRNTVPEVVTGFHYTLDDNGNRTGVDIERAGIVSSYVYGYDALNRLVSAEYPDGQVVTYTYDDNGNRLSTSTDPDGAGTAPAVVELYHYGQDNRLERITDELGNPIKEFFYDPRGNVVMLVTPTETTRYEYDYRNLLVVVEDGTNRIEYIYDGNGDRIAKIVNGERTTFVNDPNREFTQVLLELDDADAVEASYTYGEGRIRGVLSGESTPAYYIADALGSTVDLTDATAIVLQSYSYDAFGVLRQIDAGAVAGSSSNVYLFASERIDAETGLSYNRARYYDLETGRFNGKDPLGFVDSPNPYSYVLSNPVNVRDPSGLTSFGFQVLSNLTGFDRDNCLTDPFRCGEGGLRKAEEIRKGVKKFFERNASGDEFDRRSARRALQQAERFEREVFRARSSARRSSSSGRGGVLLNQAAGFVGDLASITGATVDPITGQVVLLGEGDAGGNVPDLRLDDFVSAVRAVFGSAEDPGVTLDPVPGQESNPSVPQIVGLFGGLEDTDMGWVVLEADRVMKTLSAEEDNVSGTPVTSSVSGYKSMLQRWLDRGPTENSASSRFWFVPTDVKLVRSPAGDSFVFDQTAVQLKTEDNLVGNGATDPDAQAFATWFTDNYDAIALEEYTVYDYPNETVGGEIPSQLKIFGRLEQVAKAIAFARFLYDNNIPIDFSWIENYEVPVRNTPLENRTVQNSRTASVPGGTFTITITGGVTMDAANAYLPGGGATALSNGVLGNRPDELTQQWDVNFNNQNQSAVALQLDSGHVDGLESRADVDLSYQTPGDIPFNLTRYYRSVEPTSGPFGFGWRFVPFDIDFNRPEFYSSSRSPFEYLNGLHEGEIRIVDNTTGQVLTFESTFLPRKVPGGGFGLNQRGLFTASDTLSSDLDSGSIPQVLADKFTGVGQSLSASAAVVILTTGSEWQIVDGTSRFDVSLIDNPDPAEDYLLVTSGLTDDNVPLFIPGGSEQPDGSTLTQEAGTLNYTLTRPDETQLVFDSRGRLIQWLDSRGRAITYAYTGDMVTSIADDAGQTMTLTYDAQERVTQATGVGGEVVTYTYDANGDLATAARARQAENITYSYQYDTDHRITMVTMPDQVVDTTSVTDILGRVSQSGDARGNQFHSDFDPATRTTTTTDMQNGTTVVERTDSQGRPVQSTDELGRTSKFFYDVVRVFAGNYDPVTNPNAWSYVLTAGSNRQPSLVISPDPTRPILFFEYDANGNVTRSEDIARGGDANQDGIDDNPLLFVYDTNNNLVESTDARGIVTQYTYEVLDAGTSDERTTNRQTSMTRASDTAVEATWNWGYDPTTGYLVQQTDPSGTITEYEYDALGNQTSQTVAPGTADEKVMTYTYDAFSRGLTETDSVGRTTTFTYDGRDLLLSTTLEGPPPLAFSSTYEAGTGRKLTDTDINSNLTQYTYDATTGDLTEVDEEGAVTKFEYDRFGNLQRLTDPVGNVTLFEYDDLQRLVHTVSLGSTPRILSALGSPDDIVITFAEPIDTALIDNGTDILVENSLAQLVPGSISFDATGEVLTWTANSGNLVSDTYTVTLRAQNPGEFQTPDATLLDGEYFGSFPTGDNVPGGDFMFNWLVDDHGNDFLHATPVVIPGNTAGDLEFEGDSDWFSFNAVEGSRFGFEVVLDSLLDSTLRLYDLDGETLLELNDDVDAANGQFNSRIEWEASRTGTFYLSVRGFADRRTGTYQLSMEALADDHSDDPASATAIAVPSVTPGQLELSTDADVFSFAATADQQYRITTILAGLDNALEDSFITILDTDGLTPLATNNNFFVGNPAAFLFWDAPTTDTYYIAVTSFNSQHDGAYELAVSVDDHGDHTGVPTAVAVDSQTAGDLEVKGDHDWFSIAATADTDYRFDVLLDTLENSRLVLVGADETTVLDVNDDYNGLGSSIFWSAPRTDT